MTNLFPLLHTHLQLLKLENLSLSVCSCYHRSESLGHTLFSVESGVISNFSLPQRLAMTYVLNPLTKVMPFLINLTSLNLIKKYIRSWWDISINFKNRFMNYKKNIWKILKHQKPKTSDNYFYHFKSCFLLLRSNLWITGSLTSLFKWLYLTELCKSNCIFGVTPNPLSQEIMIKLTSIHVMDMWLKWGYWKGKHQYDCVYTRRRHFTLSMASQVAQW